MLRALFREQVRVISSQFAVRFAAKCPNGRLPYVHTRAGRTFLLNRSSFRRSCRMKNREDPNGSARAQCIDMAVIETDEYEFIRQLVYDHSRINLGSDKTELVCARLRKRLRALNLESIGAYCDFLRSPAGDGEVAELLDVISTNVTDFFREADHFEFLAGVALPSWSRPGDSTGWRQIPGVERGIFIRGRAVHAGSGAG